MKVKYGVKVFSDGKWRRVKSASGAPWSTELRSSAVLHANVGNVPSKLVRIKVVPRRPSFMHRFRGVVSHDGTMFFGGDNSPAINRTLRRTAMRWSELLIGCGGMNVEIEVREVKP